jgi:type IV pilus biogenesis protein CpaD/CtpE
MATSWTRRAALAVCAAVALAGCDMNAPTHVTENPIRLEHGAFYEEMPLSMAGSDVVARAADTHARQGTGPVDLTVTYAPGAGAAERAQAQADKLAADLRRAGATHITATTLPVADPRGPLVLISFPIVTALPPEGCESMPGAGGRLLELDRQYQFGCETRTVLTRQIARPADLAGRGGLSPADGQSQAVIVARRRAGEPAEAIQAEQTQ